MPYYPLSQIQTNLFTNGNEYVFKDDRSPYKGPYYKISTGKYYSEKVPNDLSREIIPINGANNQPLEDTINPLESFSAQTIEISDERQTSDFSVYDENGNITYSTTTSNYTSNAKSRVIPSFYYPSLTQKQKDNGQFTRYFAKKTNELRYIEIGKSTFDALTTQDEGIAFDLYEPASLIWRIKGDRTELFNSNKGAALSVEQQFRWPGFPQYFKDKFTQFYLEPNTQENLYTNGGEFKTPDGKEYIGSYHIHPEKGAMVGAVHTKKKHDLLTPIAPSAPQIEPTPTAQPRPSSPPPSMGGGGYSGGGGGY